MNKSIKKLKAFTLAEVLITLAIIGVVAALTIPTLVTSYQKKMYVTQLKKSYNNLTNGFQTAMAQDGVTKLEDTVLWSKIPATKSIIGWIGDVDSYEINEKKNEEFFNEFKKTFKVSAAYDDGKLPEQYQIPCKYLNGESDNEDCKIDSGIFLSDGSLIEFVFQRNRSYVECENSKPCTSLSEFQQKRNTKTKFWYEAGFISIDVNGLKGPNIMGRDIFSFALENNGTLYPAGGIDYAVYNGCNQDDLTNCLYSWKNESGYYPCTSNSNGYGCAGRVMEEGWQMNY